MLVEQISKQPQDEFARDVRAGLTRSPQKEIPSKYLWDDVGSALFEVISALPEYGLTRADERLLRKYSDEIVSRLRLPAMAAELGSGTGKKTRYILEALSRRQPTVYYPIEISSAALARCRTELGQIEMVSIVGFEREYLDGLRAVAARRAPGEHLLVLFLGSTIGNFDRAAGDEFLRALRRLMVPGDALLLGTDLVKPLPLLLSAYEDPIGATAAFNKNLLARINRELDADFDLTQFAHEIRYDQGERRIEMHLRSLARQTVTIPKAELSVSFQDGETIWTENCHKYTIQEVFQMAERTGFRCDAQWVDPEWPFAQNLWIAI